MTGLRVMCLSNMYPGPDAPDYGAFIETAHHYLSDSGWSLQWVQKGKRQSSC